MDTWLKKIIYSKGSKVVTLIALYITTFVMVLSMIGMTVIPQQTSYFDSDEFRTRFVKKAGYVRDWIVRYDEAKIFSQVTQSQIDKYIESSGKPITEQEAVEGILADRNDYYSTIQNELVMTNKNLDYLAIDTTTGRQITNVEANSTDDIIRELTSRSNYLIGNGYYILNLKYGTGHEVSYYSDQYTTDENYYVGDKFEGQDNYRIYVAMKENLVSGDDFFVGNRFYENYGVLKMRFYNSCVAALIIDILLVVFWGVIVGRNSKDETISLINFDRIPFEIQCVIGLLGYLISLSVLQYFMYSIGLEAVFSFNKSGIPYNTLGTILFLMIWTVPISITIVLISSWIKHIKMHDMLQHIWAFKIMIELYRTIGSGPRTFLIVGGIVGVGTVVDWIMGILMVGYVDHYPLMTFMIPIIWNILCGVLVIKFIVDYKKILQVAHAITQGELNRKVELGITAPVLEEMANTVNSMGTGLEKAVGESIKSERLKTELITNVSHDLKTPLTSIISYIDLLKGENIENATAREYINVLDERSYRLKQLVEDLVEASKAITGNLKSELMVLRLDELVGQALGEYQDRIELSGLVLVTDKMEAVKVLADGRHMWRIIENLLSNVCKYAMPHTRVYIEVYSGEDYGYCVIKNISKEPLNIDPKELTERFVRGDASRTTEGSGLGLAIAQSLILLQNGLIEISIDGDLFKVMVKVPVAKQQEEVVDANTSANQSENINLDKA